MSLAQLNPTAFAALEREWESQLSYWRATRPEGAPVVPYGAQAAICDFWRERSRRQRIEAAAEMVARYGGPSAPLTVLRARPWEDLQ